MKKSFIIKENINNLVDDFEEGFSKERWIEFITEYIEGEEEEIENRLVDFIRTKKEEWIKQERERIENSLMYYADKWSSKDLRDFAERYLTSSLQDQSQTKEQEKWKR